VKDALPRRSGDGSPFWESGFGASMALSLAVIFLVDADDAKDADG